MRHCPICAMVLDRRQEMFLRLVPKGFFVFEHRVNGQKFCQRAHPEVNTVEGGQALMKTLGIVGEE